MGCLCFAFAFLFAAAAAFIFRLCIKITHAGDGNGDGGHHPHRAARCWQRQRMLFHLHTDTTLTCWFSHRSRFWGCFTSRFVSSFFLNLVFYFSVFFSRYSRVIKRSKFVMYTHTNTHVCWSLCECVVAFLLDCLMCQVRHYFIYQCDIGFVSSLFFRSLFFVSLSLLIYVNCNYY